MGASGVTVYRSFTAISLFAHAKLANVAPDQHRPRSLAGLEANSCPCPRASANEPLHSPRLRSAIKALSEAASPRNFEIWYHYATGYNLGLNQSINETLAKNDTLSEADLNNIYATYIAPNRVNEQIDTVGARVLG
jgi:hypothetical protein